ncbi:ATP-dependent nuclease [Thalassoglobus polymorphus]|uniref:AAA+ ATPase domain-containing protein n=1 Tax=Thalassoglobus polymorphus TaxID=2527994 RepID=A0A517QQP7_9PLAN|nr:AAA family ATPase [Thalassoglobus polymorphus]QDT33956.1 hypothetical protein Mal48_32130 [Thalassoglobus polymorphus]
MTDHREELQATFLPNRRHSNYGEAIIKIRIQGIRNHKDTLVEIESPITAFCGVNGTGKSTVLQLAAAAYGSPSKRRYYVSTFILAGNLDHKPFEDDSSVEFTYAGPTSAGKADDRLLTLSRSGSSWSGYDRQPERRVVYLGVGFYLPHAERDDYFKSLVQDRTFTSRSKIQVNDIASEWVSRILLCKYDAAHVNAMRKKWGRSHTRMLSAKREGGFTYSESNMGSGEARLYAMVLKLEEVEPHSLILLEEPETSLHPSAQFELGKYLVNVAARRNLQILLTSHSEYLLLALPQKSRVYLKREGDRIVPIPGIGVRQALSMMDNFAIRSLYILVEDDVAKAIVIELLRMHDTDFLQTVEVVIAGDASKIQQTIDVFVEQRMPICAVRDGDQGDNVKKRMLKLFGTMPPEKEIFASKSFRDEFKDKFKVDWGAIDIRCKELDDQYKSKSHHYYFEELKQKCVLDRSELLAVSARAYLRGIPESVRIALVEQIKAATL